METKILENVRFRHLYAALDIWQSANPIILSGELALVKDDNNRMKIKIGTGKTFNDTAYLYSMDRWTNKYKNLAAADDANIKPSDAKGYNTEDFLQIFGDLIYPINLTTSVRLKDGTKLQTWMDNVKTNNVTMSGDLRINRAIGGDKPVLRIITDDVNGTSIALSAGGNTLVASGEAEYKVQPLLNAAGENLYLASDQSIFLYTKCQTDDTMRNIVFNGDAFYPGSNNNIDLGASSYRWKGIYTYSIDVDNVLSAKHLSLKTNSTTTVKGISGQVGNDYWRVGGALSSADVDSGYMELSTGDNGNEPIYVRQYTGAFTTLVRTLTLLDVSGNSLFPGSISEKGVTLENKYLQRSGALPMTGTLDMGMHHSIRFRVNSNGSSAVGNVFRNSDDSTFGGIGTYGTDGVAEHIYIGLGESPWETGSGISLSATQFKYKNNTIWHAGNDGANSGLDADLLDGKHASAFSLTSHTHSYAGSASVGGPANSALKLQTARKIGNASFDGTADITIAQMGVSPEAGSDKLSKLAQTITLGGGRSATILQDNGTFRQKIEIVDTSIPNDEVFVFSQSSNTGVNWSELFAILDNGTIRAKQFTGNSVSASKLQTVRKIGNANFDGTANITVEQIGAAPTVHGHNILDAAAVVLSTGSTYLNNYAKVAEYKLKSRYASVATTFECITGSHGETKNDYFKLHVWVKQQEALGTDPYIYISSSGRDNTTKKAKFYVQIDEKTSTYTKVSLYAKILSYYTSLRMYRLADSSSNSDITYLKNKDFVATLSEVGEIVEEVDCTGKHVHTKSQITDFPTSLKNPTNLVIKLNGGTTEGTNLFTYDGSISKTLDITPDTIGARPAGATLLNPSIDLNDIITEGEYYAYGGNTIKNKPCVGAFGLRVQRSSLNNKTQIIYISNDEAGTVNRDKVFVRTSNTTDDNTIIWTDWSMLYSTKYKPTPTDVGAAPAVHTHPYLPLAGGNMAGTINMGTNSIKYKSSSSGGCAIGIHEYNSDDTLFGGIGFHSKNGVGDYLYLGFGDNPWDSTTAGLLIYPNEMKFKNNKVWHAGNDGAGSGLDADTVDGLQATDLAKAVHTHTKSQITDFPASLKNPTSLVIKLNSGTVEGTNMFTYDGSIGKSFDITPKTIGARPAEAIVLAANADLNTLKTEGEYYATGGNTCVDKPDGINAFGLKVQRTAAGYFTQTLISSDRSRNKTYIRTCNEATEWTEWESLYSTKYKPTPTDVGAAPAVHTHPYLPLAGGTMTGNIGMKVKSNPTTGATSSTYFIDPTSTEVRGGFGTYFANDKFMYLYIGTGSEAWRSSNALTISETDIAFHDNKVWHAGNDGVGSGLDADLLDGLQATAFAKASHTHTKAQITDFPVSLKNPNALTISLNGTSQGAYDGSAAKSINITPAGIGAAAASHTHTKAQITDFPTTLPNAGALTISLNGTSQGAYDGSAAKSINITPAGIGAATAGHTHNYAGSSSVGGSANAAVKLVTARKIGNAAFDGTADITIAQIGAAAASHTHDYLPLTGGTISGQTVFQQGTSAFYSNGENGKAGYVLMAEIKIVEAYQNVPIIFEVINRGASQIMTVSLLFNNSNNADPTLNSFTYYGYNGGAYIHKASAGTWNLYIKKSEAYDTICISRIIRHSSYKNTKITWKGTLVTALPDGCLTATLHTIASTATKLTTARKIGNALFDGTADITVAQIGAAAAGHTHNYAGSSSAGGNANAAVKLATARKIGNASFDGTADITVAAIGAAAASHTHSYLPLSGGTVTGSITSSLVTNTYLEGNKGKAIINSSAEANKYVMLAKLNSTNGYFTDGVYQDKRLFQYTPKTTVDAGTNSVAKSVTILNEAGNSIFPGTVTAPTFSGSLSGTASAATKLATARKIGNIAFDGTADITIAQIGAAAASHTHTKAQITDFPTSLKNPTALTISLNGTSQGAYDGSAAKAINITAASVGAAVISHTHNYAGSSSAGGNANAAVKLATARKIGNASFDGTANITAAQMGVAPSNLIYKNITIATSAWNTTTKIYEYANASITANHIPQVFFNNATLDAAGKAGIIVYTEAGKLVLKCTTIPTASLVIETAILTPV